MRTSHVAAGFVDETQGVPPLALLSEPPRLADRHEHARRCLIGDDLRPQQPELWLRALAVIRHVIRRRPLVRSRHCEPMLEQLRRVRRGWAAGKRNDVRVKRSYR